MNTTTARPDPGHAGPYGILPTLDPARELAGDDAVPLVTLSRRLSPGHHLVLSPATASVLWATRQPEGGWLVTELSADQALQRVPARCPDAAVPDYQLLLHAALNSRPRSLSSQIADQIAEHHARLSHLTSLQSELAES